jgi:hypothetical protein
MGGKRRILENITCHGEITICHQQFAKKFHLASPLQNSELCTPNSKQEFLTYLAAVIFCIQK